MDDDLAMLRRSLWPWKLLVLSRFVIYRYDCRFRECSGWSCRSFLREFYLRIPLLGVDIFDLRLSLLSK